MSVKGLIVAIFVAFACFGVANAAESRSTSDVDSARFAEYHSIFGGVVMGYTAADHGVQVRHEGEAMAEGEKCGMHEDGCCGCNKCGCKKSCGCGSCHKSCGCDCPGAAYDCWGVWQGDSYNFAATRDSDYDPVLGDGGRGTHSFFGWGGW